MSAVPWFTASWLLAAALVTFVPAASAWSEWTRPGSDAAKPIGAWLVSLATCHFAHFGGSHWTWNAVVLAATGALVERAERRALLVATALAVFAIPLALPFVDPSLASYRGASGIASTWFTLALVLVWRRTTAPAGRVVLALGAAAYVAKLLVESATGAAVFADSGAGGFQVVSAAHAIGTACGISGSLLPGTSGRLVPAT